MPYLAPTHIIILVFLTSSSIPSFQPIFFLSLSPPKVWTGSGRQFAINHTQDWHCTCWAFVVDWTQVRASVIEGRRFWKAQAALQRGPKFRCDQSSSRAPLSEPRVDSLDSSDRHCLAEIQNEHICKFFILKISYICTPVSFQPIWLYKAPSLLTYAKDLAALANGTWIGSGGL